MFNLEMRITWFKKKLNQDMYTKWYGDHCYGEWRGTSHYNCSISLIYSFFLGKKGGGCIQFRTKLKRNRQVEI